MKVSVAYADGIEQLWLRLEIAEGSTAVEAIHQSGVLEMCPGIDLTTQKIGIYGKLVKPDTPLQSGDRVEIYRPITCDPNVVPRRDVEDEDD